MALTRITKNTGWCSVARKNNNDRLDEDRLNDEDTSPDIAFKGFEKATPQQLARLRIRHAGATSDLADTDLEKKEDLGEYEMDIQIARDARQSVLDLLFGLVKRIWAPTEYDNLRSARFNHCLSCAGTALFRKFQEVQQDVMLATEHARETPNADNFVALESARLQRKIVATEVVMAHATREGKTEEYNEASASHEEFTRCSEQLGEISGRMVSMSELEKKELLAESFGEHWTEYQKGHLTADKPGEHVSVRQAASRGGIDQPFIQTLKDLFSAAGRFLTGNTSSPETASQTRRVQPQLINN
jgi:hypothetical protein